MEKNLDNKGRWRDITVSFRMSKSERDDLDMRVNLSGLTKQDYLIKRVLCRDIIVTGNPRVYKALRNKMEEILYKLEEMPNCGNEDIELFSTIQMVAITLNGLKFENKGD